MTSPLEQLCTLLGTASSDNPQIRIPAEEQLKSFETAPSFYETLLTIFLEKSIEVKIRWLAIICFKNGIDKYWRKTAKNAIAEDEKKRIRSRILVFDEEHKQLATQLAVVISKISRHDFPGDWTDLMQVITSVVQNTFLSATSFPPEKLRLIQQRSLYTLHLVVKVLCSKTLPSSRRMLEQLTPDLFKFLSGVFYDHANVFVTRFQSTSTLDAETEAALTVVVLSLKCLRRLMVYGFGTGASSMGKEQHMRGFHRNELSAKFFKQLLAILTKCIELRNVVVRDLKRSSPNLLDKLILGCGKMYIDLIKNHPVEFVLADGSVEVIAFYWSLADAFIRNSDDMLERFIVQGLILLRKVVKNSELTQPLHGPTDPTITQAQQKIVSQLLTPEFNTNCVHTLIKKYLTLTSEDMESWESDPESWIQEEEGDHWEYNSRSCSEKLVMDFLSSRRDQLGPLLIQTLMSVSNTSSDDMESVLLKDAVYSAVGLCAQDCYDFVEFDGWFASTLVNESQKRQAEFHKILRRRVSILIGQWVSVKCSREMRPKVYETILPLLNESEDMVIRLTSVNTLRLSVDDWDFEATQFVPYLPQAISLLAALVNNTDEFESKLKILNCISVIIERMESHVLPFAERITMLLPELWEQSEGQHMFRAAILVILTKLVVALKDKAMQLEGLVLPIIRHAVSDKDARLYLFEDGLDLWMVTVQNFSQCTPALLELMGIAIESLDYATESLKKILKLIECYILLDALAVLRMYVQPLIAAYYQLIGALRPEAARAILNALDITLQACSMKGCFQDMARTIASSGLLEKMVAVVFENKVDDPRPTFLMHEVGFVLTGYLNLFARMVLYDYPLFQNMMTELGQKCSPPIPSLLPAVLDAWIDKWDAVGHPKSRKLIGMAVAQIMVTQDIGILSNGKRMNGIFMIVTSVFSDMRASRNHHFDEDVADEAIVYWHEAREEDEDEESFDGKRRRELLEHDPVTRTLLSQWLKTKFTEAETLHGSTFRQQLPHIVEGHLLESLSSFMR